MEPLKVRRERNEGIRRKDKEIHLIWRLANFIKHHLILFANGGVTQPGINPFIGNRVTLSYGVVEPRQRKNNVFAGLSQASPSKGVRREFKSPHRHILKPQPFNN